MGTRPGQLPTVCESPEGLFCAGTLATHQLVAGRGGDPDPGDGSRGERNLACA